VLNALIIQAKPDAIPGHLSVDVSELEIGHTITVADLVLPEGVTTEVDPDETVVTAQLTSLALAEEEEEAVEGEGEEGEEGAEGEAGEAEAGESAGGDADRE
jgi:large subunit ribosomal protein L25